MPDRVPATVCRSSSAMLGEYGKVPMFVNVQTRLRLEHFDDDLMGLGLVEEPVHPSYIKSYEDPNETPSSWAARWDLSSWGFVVATQDDRVVGGCVIAYRTNGVNMLEGRDDVAVLWDIRVHPSLQRCGIGSRLFEQAVAFAQERSCKYLKIETQNVNVPACRFYQRQGCYLGGIREHAYKELPHEIELLWYLPLARSHGA